MEMTGINYGAYEHNMYTRRKREDSKNGGLRRPPNVAMLALFGQVRV